MLFMSVRGQIAWAGFHISLPSLLEGVHPTSGLKRLPMALSRPIMSIIMPHARLWVQSTVDMLA